MVSLAMILASLFVVVPSQRAEAFVPLVFIGGAAVATAAPAIAVSTTSLVTFAGAALLGSAALLFGASFIGGQLADAGDADTEEPALELEVRPEEQEAIDTYVQSQTATAPAGDTALPVTWTGGIPAVTCSQTIRDVDYFFDTATSAPYLRVSLSGTGGTTSNNGASDSQLRSACGPPTTISTRGHNTAVGVAGELVNTTTGARLPLDTGADYPAGTARTLASWDAPTTWLTPTGPAWERSLTIRQNVATYPPSQGWYLEAIGMRSHIYHPYGTNKVFKWANPYSPTGGRLDVIPEGYWGVRECINLSTRATTTVEARSDASIPIPAACPDGAASLGYRIYQGDPDGNGVEILSSMMKSGWNLDAGGANLYPGCVDASGAMLGTCELAVTVDGRTCGYGVVGCAGWMDLAAEGRNVVCLMGTYEMHYSDCDVLRYAYSTPYGVEAEMQMIPSRVAPPIPGTMPPQPSIAPAPAVQPDRTTYPMTPTNPPPTRDPAGAGTMPWTGTNPITRTELASNPRDLPGCLSSMWTWNPVDWVATPVRCVFEWAFVPQPLLVRQLQADMQTSVQTTTAMQIARSVAGIGAMAGGASGCSGPHLHLDLMSVQYDGYPLSACAEPMSGAATVARTLATIAVTIMALLAMGRHVGATFGFNSQPGGDS
jgi:hypothetical protein